MGFGKPYFIYQMKIKERPYHLEYLKTLIIKEGKSGTHTWLHTPKIKNNYTNYFYNN